MNKFRSVDETLVGTEESTGAVIRRCSVNKVFSEFTENHRKTPMSESLFNEALDLQTCNVVKK